MTSLVEQLYRDLARTATDRMPLVSEVIETEGWREFVAAVTDLDSSSVNQDTGLRDPRVQFDRLRPTQRAVSEAQTLERFQLFHTPPATPIARQEPRRDDARIDARWLEYQRSPLPKREDIAKQLDFHQIVAAMGSYPTLMRRLGLVVDLLLAPGGFPSAASADLSVKVVFPSGALQVPRTADAVRPRSRVSPPRISTRSPIQPQTCASRTASSILTLRNFICCSSTSTARVSR